MEENMRLFQQSYEIINYLNFPLRQKLLFYFSKFSIHTKGLYLAYILH